MADGKFSGVPAGSALEAKIERCVRKVKLQGHDKSSAIAICRSKIKKEVVQMVKNIQKRARQRRKEKKKLEARKTPEAQALADNPTADFEEYEKAEELSPELVEFLMDFDDGEDETKSEEENPLSFEELDTQREIQEEDEVIQKNVEDAKELLQNILEVDIETEEKADAIVNVGNELKERLSNLLKSDCDDCDDFDLEIAQIESLALIEKQSIGEKLSRKAKLTSRSRNDLPDSAFACILPGGKKDETGRTKPRSLRRFPIHDKAHVRNALARIKQGKTRSNVAACARSKVLAAAKKMGIGRPSEKNSNAIVVEKDKNGDLRWIGWTSSNFKDLDGDIISEEAHKEFVRFLDTNPDMAPLFLSWHTKGSQREAPVDAWLYENGFMIYSGVLTEPEAISLLKVMRKEKLGMSHGFIGIRDPNDRRVISKYRTFEVSDLPLDNAAFPYTDLDIILKEAGSMNKLDYLKDILGEKKVEKLLEDTALKQKLLREEGHEEKDKKLEEKKDPSPHVEIMEAIRTDLGLEKLSDYLKELETRVETLEDGETTSTEVIKALAEELKEKSKDVSEQIADRIEGKAGKSFAWMQARASQSKDTELKESDEKDKKLLDSTPGVKDKEGHWLSADFGVPPLIEEAEVLS